MRSVREAIAVDTVAIHAANRLPIKPSIQLN